MSYILNTDAHFSMLTSMKKLQHKDFLLVYKHKSELIFRVNWNEKGENFTFEYFIYNIVNIYYLYCK